MADLNSAAQNIDILVVVNALASSNLGDNVYLIDSNKYCGSGHEGQNELYTNCVAGQTINWRVVDVSQSASISITKFTDRGDGMITKNECIPAKKNVGAVNEYWSGMVNAVTPTPTPQKPANFQYTMEITINGKALSFDPFLNVIG
jgi:hypothetical protein